MTLKILAIVPQPSRELQPEGLRMSTEQYLLSGLLGKG